VTRCDVLIVGGGPAGSTCAWKLRAAGVDVLLIDRQGFPRDKTCAGWVTPQVMQELDLDLDDYTAAIACGMRRTLQPITGFRTGLIGGRTVDNHYDHPVSYGIRRCEFDHYLLQRSGVTTQLGIPFRGMERTSGKWIVNGEIEADIVVGAGGHFCPVARQLGARTVEGSSVVAAQEIEFAPPPEGLARCGARAEIPELYFCQDLAGYGWCFRKGDYLNIGLGRTNSDGLSTHVRDFCDFLQSTGTLACETRGKFHGHAYQLYERVPPKLVDDGVLLIGDAAGLAYPQSGEGIRPAVESALIAADVIRSAGGNYSRNQLASYATRLTERLGPPRTSTAADWLPASWLRFVASKLMVSRRFARDVIIDKWFLHSQQAALQA